MLGILAARAFALGGFSRFSGGHALHHAVGFALLVIASKVVLISIHLVRRSFSEGGSPSFLVAKPDLDSHCIHRLQTTPVSPVDKSLPVRYIQYVTMTVKLYSLTYQFHNI